MRLDDYLRQVREECAALSDEKTGDLGPQMTQAEMSVFLVAALHFLFEPAPEDEAGAAEREATRAAIFGGLDAILTGGAAQLGWDAGALRASVLLTGLDFGGQAAGLVGLRRQTEAALAAAPEAHRASIFAHFMQTLDAVRGAGAP